MEEKKALLGTTSPLTKVKFTSKTILTAGSTRGPVRGSDTEGVLPLPLDPAWKGSDLGCFVLNQLLILEGSRVRFSRSVVSDSLRPQGLWLSRLLCP